MAVFLLIFFYILDVIYNLYFYRCSECSVAQIQNESGRVLNKYKYFLLDVLL